MRRAVAGATRTRSAVWPRRVWGIGSLSSHSEVRTRSDARAENVTSPTNRVASSDSTGMTWQPASTNRRHSSTALYAAMPPVTPRTMRRRASTAKESPASSAITPSASPSARRLLDRLLEVLGPDVDDLAALRLLAGGQLQPAGHVLVVVSPGPEPLGLGLGRGRHEQDHDSGGIGGPDLLGPLHVDLQQHVLARRRLRRRRAVQVTEI